MPAKVLSQGLDATRFSADWNARYISLLLEEVSISAYCAQSHDSSQRVARVLLEALDNLRSGSEVTLTRCKLADLVGVRRETVSVDRTKLNDMGIVSTTTGKINIKHRERLSEIACDCYRQAIKSRMAAFDLWNKVPWKVD